MFKEELENGKRDVWMFATKTQTEIIIIELKEDINSATLSTLKTSLALINFTVFLLPSSTLTGSFSVPDFLDR